MLTTEEQKSFIIKMYDDLFTACDASKIPSYCTPDFVEENNYKRLDYDAFVAHVNDLAKQDDKAQFEIEFLINQTGYVLIRTLVIMENQIKGAPPASLVLSYWRFNQEGKVDLCQEVEHES